MTFCLYFSKMRIDKIHNLICVFWFNIYVSIEMTLTSTRKKQKTKEPLEATLLPTVYIQQPCSLVLVSVKCVTFICFCWYFLLLSCPNSAYVYIKTTFLTFCKKFRKTHEKAKMFRKIFRFFMSSSCLFQGQSSSALFIFIY